LILMGLMSILSLFFSCAKDQPLTPEYKDSDVQVITITNAIVIVQTNIIDGTNYVNLTNYLTNTVDVTNYITNYVDQTNYFTNIQTNIVYQRFRLKQQLVYNGVGDYSYTSTYTYTGNVSNYSQETRTSGSTYNYTYYGSGLMYQRTLIPQNLTTTFTYDFNPDGTVSKQNYTWSTGSGTITFYYDEFKRITSYFDSVGSFTYVYSYTNDTKYYEYIDISGSKRYAVWEEYS